jgi:hypothetical protein
VPANPSPTPPDMQANLIKNAGFEKTLDTLGWELYKQEGIDRVTESRFGDYALRSTQVESTSGDWAGISQDLSVQSGKTYNFTAWLKWENATQVHMKVVWLDASDAKIDEVPLMIEDGNSKDWVQKGDQVIAPHNTKKARVFIWHGVKNNKDVVPGGAVYIDQIEFSPNKVDSIGFSQTSNSCLSAEIVSPKGAENRQNAGNFPVQNQFNIKWEPSDCKMTVQYYQNLRG